MTYFNRRPNIDLPEFKDIDIAWHHGSVQKAASSGGKTFVRSIKLPYNFGKTVNDTLEIADELFETVAAECGATVVTHTWGLYKVPRRLRETARFTLSLSDELPRNHVLLAEVEAIPDAHFPGRAAQQQITAGITQHEFDPVSKYEWVDAKLNQFVEQDDHEQGTSRTFLVDIEPLIVPR
ncbi:MAG TPA: hypothetical protein VF572_06995 [Candidatus Saccharimonadales bacterium]|jgi:hypothetical protein